MTASIFSNLRTVAACFLLMLAGPAAARAFQADGGQVEASAELRAAGPGRATLSVTAKMESGWHIYSISQPPGGPVATKIRLDKSADFEVGKFSATVPPKRHKDPAIWGDLQVEEHAGEVTWTAEVTFAAGVNPANVKISGAVVAQACSDVCLPPKSYKFVANFAGEPPPSAEDPPPPSPAVPLPPVGDAERAPEQPSASAAPRGVPEYRGPNTHAIWSGRISPSVVQPGGTIQLSVQARPVEGFYVYGLENRPSEVGAKPTLIVLREPQGWRLRDASSSASPREKRSELTGGNVRYHSDPVTWTGPIAIPADTKPGRYQLEGMLGFQTCNDEQCDIPQGVSFVVEVEVAAAGQGESARPIEFLAGRSVSYSDVAKAALRLGDPGVRGSTASSSSEPLLPGPIAPEEGSPPPPAPVGGEGPTDAQPSASGEFDLSQVRVDEPADEHSTAVYLLWGFLGGLILNLMPCVLPVVGLKILSFVEQGHHDRWRVLQLNLWYVAGLMLVFMALATVPVVMRSFGEQFAWGAQFGNMPFTITLTAIVFAMALAMLGVWEIPIPGFLGSSTANSLSSKEGAAGAFAKGIITTLLATPCTGPYMATAISWAVAQPAPVVFATFAAVGLGMASPYLVLGANPRLIRFLPKPGAWMDTFKQLMGFVLLGTVVYLLTTVQPTLVVPTVCFLIALWGACWWIGRTPLTADLSRRLMAWGWGAAFAGGMALFSFQWLHEVMDERWVRRVDAEIAERLQSKSKSSPDSAAARSNGNTLDWKPYSLSALAELSKSQQTVMVDFTADWCATCQVMSKFVLNTEGTKRVVERNKVATLLADYTDVPAEITKMLTAIQSNGVPALAIFPAGRPYQPIVIRGTYTQDQLIEAIERAGPSRQAGQSLALRAAAE